MPRSGGRGSGGRNGGPGRGGSGRGGRGSGGGSGRGSGRGGYSGRQGVCYEFQRTGTCRFGNRCRFQHAGGSSNRRNQVPQMIPRSSGANLHDFLRHLSMAGDRLSTELETSQTQWYKCFQSHATLPKNARTLLLQVLAKTPGSCALDPPDLLCCERIVQEFLKENCGTDDDLTLTAVKTVHDVVDRLLQFTWDTRRETIQETLSNIIAMGESKLNKRLSDHRDVGKRLMRLMEELERSWRIKVRFQDEELDETVPNEDLKFADWKQADVQWLCNPNFFAPSRCPKMLVGDYGVYHSTEEYMDTVLQLWVAMTFADGHAAFAPHCRAHGNNGTACGNALWPVSSIAPNMRCRTRGCPYPVEYSCRINSHDSLCLECSAESVRRHCQGPGKEASTHVYDCEIHRYNEEGIVYMKNFKSRNPPPNVHWRTTKRLSPPNLVGLVPIKCRHGTLQPHDKIVWGEVVYHGDSRDEERRRQNGQLAVNVWSLQDNVDLDTFVEDKSVAVVDCMSFVPEWIPVLKALVAQKQARLPLENGRYLNLSKSEPVECISVVSESCSARDVFEDNHELVIQRILDTSLLEPIREIRRDDNLRQELVQKLTRLVDETTLDIMQFVSFLDALCNPLHLTQGPPGTGKSYLGVVLVRSLMIIRSLWLRKSRSTASPPILVLSYKNMAINHFLLDLIKNESRSLSSSNLIRIGGNMKDMDPRLVPFSERSFYQHDLEVQQKRTVVEKLTSLRNSIENVIAGALSSFLSYQERMFGAATEQERRLAANDFTEFLMACIVRLHLFKKEPLEESDGSKDPVKVLKALSFLELESSTLKPCNKILHLMGNLTESLLPILEEAYCGDARYHWGDLLLMWIQGKRPLPQCTSSGCLNRSICHEIQLCDDHRCHTQDAGPQRCQEACSASRSRFCVTHQCSLMKCSNEKLSEVQSYCKYHACRRCLELGAVAKLACGSPPANVCSDHSLCTFPQCTEYCVYGELCCEKHLYAKCHAITKKGKPCKGKPLSRYLPYCPDHRHLPPPICFQLAEASDDSESSDEEEDQNLVPSNEMSTSSSKACAAITRNGCKCREAVLPGSEFCYDHQPPEREMALSSVASHRYPSSEGTKQNPEVESQAIQNADDKRTDLEYEETEVEGENLQHLRDVFEAPDETDSHDDEFLDACETIDGVIEESSSSLANVFPNEWTWSMTSEERIQACLSLVGEVRRKMSEASNKVKKAHLLARKDLQHAKIRAKTRVYENKSIIGGTMVGCISRLESIRATRPFAIIVEEASEVLEPLLFSCLSESTVKLEMIGDHRQLQPSVMNRFDYEIMCNVNTSMFQRLIEAPHGHGLPSTVLSVQRRMRRNIADLTRDFYKDLVEIEDHDSCSKQRIGNRNTGSSDSLVKATSTRGREVPGIAPHVFLWTHRGAQGRAHVGISRINQTEAEMACALATHLRQCGVPKSSIAILTPYKGQLMLIRSLLQKDKRFYSASLLPRDRANHDTCRVSTVDRFQGDEEDVVIVSLVVDEKSKTGFVKLANRMIVLLSRARLGCYMLANQGFLGNGSSIPKHWSQTLDRLRNNGSNDSGEDLVKGNEQYTGNRIGAELPLCCPIHRGNRKLVSSPENFSLGFCTEICNTELSCGHTCPLNCHWPRSSHVAKCDKKLDSPCSRHVKPVPCHAAYGNATGFTNSTSHKQILQFYRCPVKVILQLPCEHELQVECWKEKQVMDGSRTYPICRKRSSMPFTFAGCGHSVDTSCEELAKYTEDPSLVRCQEIVQYEPTCGHVVPLKCFERKELLDKVRSHDCKKKLPIVLPRCGHEAKSVACFVAQKIYEWTGQACQEVGTLIEGTPYGPQDHSCRKKAKITRSCGHHVELSCVEAFARSQSLPPCQESVETLHPICGHFCQVPCEHANMVQSYDAPDPLVEWKEGQAQANQDVNLPIPRCQHKIQLVRRCGHVETISCSDKALPLRPCKSSVDLKSPICGHVLNVSCADSHAFHQKVWPEGVMAKIEEKSPIDSNLLKKHLRMSDSLIGTVLKQTKNCKETILVLLPCGHSKLLACSELDDFASGFYPELSVCGEEATVHLECGHNATVACHVAEKYKMGDSSVVVCKATKHRQCWNFDQCGHKLTVQCSIQDDIACDAKIQWQCPAGQHSYDLPVCSQGEPSWCPGCYTENLRSISNLPSTVQPPPEVTAIKTLLPSECIEVLHGNETTFFSKEKDVIRKQAAVKPFEQTRVDICRVPCFRCLQGGQVDAGDFDPSKFVSKKSAFGVIAKTLTKANLEKMADKMADNLSFGKIKVLIGYATVARMKDSTDKELPRKEQRAAMMDAFNSQEFDAMMYLEKDMENLVVWDPFPMIAIYRIAPTKEQFMGLADGIPDWKKPNFTAERITFVPPSQKLYIVASTSSPNYLSDDSDSESEGSESNNRRQEFKQILAGTILEQLSFDLDWAGGFSFAQTVPSANESDILQKMQFVNPKAKPFAALNRLKELSKRYPNFAILNLLMAAECSIHSQDKAKEHLQLYINAFNVDTDLAHPWTLVVFARLFEQYKLRALQLYAREFPQQTNVMTEDELKSLRAAKVQNQVGARNWHDQLCDDWAKIRKNNPSKTVSPSTDALVSLTGLRKVKEQVLKLWKSALQLSRMKDPETRKKNSFVCNYIFVGNPGTGKTTVARLLANILHDCGLRPEPSIVETTAQAVKDEGADAFRKNVSAANGGCFFIDEAYDLDPVGDLSGKPIVNELLTLSEDKRDEISFILAGYEDEFEARFFAYNDGLRSRFKTITFEDFDEHELATIWKGMRENKEWSEEQGVCRVVVRRMAKITGRKGFGNAREVRRRLEEATQSAMSRLGDDFDDSMMTLTVEDVIGQDPRLQNEKLKRVVDEIEEKIGWQRVKQQVKSLLELCGVNYRRELLGQTELDIFQNRLFLGNPGTGKTTCAKLYGRLLKELGFLSNGEVVSKTASDFVGQYVGQSQTKTSQILESAKGKVLIIDECYALDDNLYGKQVLDTIVEKVHGSPSEDIAVLLLGYEEQMLKMISNQNPGLNRRFPKDQAFYFDDYDDSELLQILDLNLKKNQVSVTMEFRERFLEVLQTQRRQNNFGNASAAELLVKAAILKAAKRDTSAAGNLVLEETDINSPGSARANKDIDPLAMLDSLYKMDKVKEKLDKMRKTWSVAKQDGEDQPKLGHFVFTGSPGTGKTTVARTIANVLYSLGLLPSDKIVETSALDLTAGFVGQTKDKVNAALDEAKGGVLFIDEAYNLGLGHFGKEACDTIVAAMTSKSYCDVVIVIAGYPDEIHEMLTRNSGLKSRFNHFFEFPDWDPEDCVAFLQMLAERENFEIEELMLHDFEAACENLRKLDGWGNGRDVTKLWEMAKSNRGFRVYDSGEVRKIISMEDMAGATSEMMDARKPRKTTIASGKAEASSSNHDAEEDSLGSEPPMVSETGTVIPPRVQSNDACQEATQTESDEGHESEQDSLSISNVGDEEESIEDNDVTDNDGRDDGVPDDIWNELLDTKRRQKEQQDALAQREAAYQQYLLEQQRCEDEASRLHQEKLERIRREAERNEQERLIQEALEADRRRRQQEELERQRKEREIQKEKEKERKRLATIRRLQIIGRCPAGFEWYQQGCGWRCGGGSHFVSDEELRKRFGSDAIR